MAAGMSDQTVHLQRLLEQLLSADNVVRPEAERQYNAIMEATPDLVVPHLIALLKAADSVPENIRTMSSILLYRLADIKRERWSKLSEGVQEGIKTELLAAFATEPTGHIARKIGYIIAQLAATEMESWGTSLMQLVSAQLSDESGARKSLGFFLLGQLCEFASSAMAPFADWLLSSFRQGLAYPDMAVQLEALQGVVMFLGFASKEDQEKFQSLVPDMVQVLQRCFTGSATTQQAEQAMAQFIQLALQAPFMLQQQLAQLLPAMISIARNASFDYEMRALGLEFMVTLAERASAMMRSVKDAPKEAVHVALELMSHMEDTEEWMEVAYAINGADDITEDDAESKMGSDSLYRLAGALGDAVVPCAFMKLPQLMGGDWAARRAACMCLGLMAEGANKALQATLPALMAALMDRAVTDEHPRVRFAAFSALGLLCTDFESLDDFHATFGDKFIKAVTLTMADESLPPVLRAHAATALINFCSLEECPGEVVADRLGLILPALGAMLVSSHPAMKLQSVTALARVARVAQEAFCDHYATSMSLLKAMMSEVGADNSDLARELRGKALQCVGLIGEAVGRELFEADAMAVLDVLLRDMESSGRLAASDDDAEYVLHAMVSIARALQDRFVPALPRVLPMLLNAAQMDPDVKFTDVDPEAKSGVDNDGQDGMVLALRGVGNLRVTMDVTVMKMKTAAVKALFDLAEALGSHFAPYVSGVADVVLPLAKYEWSHDVRYAASWALPRLLAALLKALKDAGASTESAQALLMTGYGYIAANLGKEHNRETLCSVVEAFKETMEICLYSGDDNGTSPVIGLPLDAARNACSVLCDITRNCMDRRTDIAQAMADRPVVDEEEEAIVEEAMEMESELMTNVVDSIGYMLKLHKAAFVPIFVEFVEPTFGPLLAGDVAEPLQPMIINALCLFDDVMEWCGAEAHARYGPTFVPLAMSLLGSEDNVIRQIAVYGLGQIAEHAPAYLAKHVKTLINKLVAMIRQSDARSEDLIDLTENAVSALGRICRFMSDSSDVNVSLLLPLWVSQLPLTEDTMEAKHNHKLLCDYVMEQNPHVVGPNFAHLPSIVSTMATVLVGANGGDDGELASDETKQRMAQLLRLCPQNLPKQVWDASWAGLSEAQQKAVSEACGFAK